MDPILRVLVCGTGYGATYLQALWNHDSRLRLAGILARGSERSRALARQWDVPLWHSAEEVPESGGKAIDLACVAVGGPAGTALTLALLRRGVHVLAEHPVAPEEMAAALAAAREHGAIYHVNAHYADLETVAPFLTTAAACRRRSPPLFITAATNPRALYSCVELIGRLLETLEPCAFQAAGEEVRGPLAVVNGTAGGVPILVECQRLVTAEDDGSCVWASHQVKAGFAEGTLMLAETAGPVLWVPASPSTAELAAPGAADRLACPSWSLLSGPPPATGDFLFRLRDRANRLALRRIAEQVRTGRASSEQSETHLLAVSRAWSAILSCVGPLEVVGS
ncbi:MAG TPA: Gfo/Idh/MocA family oxidoreductase [Thermoanaerobaculia bacterium]|jgi:thiazolinyl imide reductase|nr:Gfo/Idh/MocA family oxidoreductase [Thermoanaerobaculia bacterium]